MKPLFLTILIILTICSCTHQQLDGIRDTKQNDASAIQTTVQDSIDKYGYSGCVKPAPSELYQSLPEVMDSLWTMLLVNNQKNKTTNKYSKDKLKEALIKDNFLVDSCNNGFIATKKVFNRRLRATWKNDSDTVELYLTRWYKGYTYDFFSSNNKFDK